MHSTSSLDAKGAGSRPAIIRAISRPPRGSVPRGFSCVVHGGEEVNGAGIAMFNPYSLVVAVSGS